MKHTLSGTLLIGLCLTLSSALDESPEAGGTPGGSTGKAAAPVSSVWQRVTDRIYCGGEPAGFEALAAQGFTAVVSVDGIPPDVAAARRAGLRYVHIPMGYDGVHDHARLSLARLVQELDGPMYIHCHHGHHRAPVAAAVAGILAGELDHARGLELLRRAGTSPDFVGLWHAVETCERPARGTHLPELVETADLASTAEVMAKIDWAWAKLRMTRDVGWTKAQQPHEQAVLLREGFREFRRSLADDLGDDFTRRLADAEQLAQQLGVAVETQDWRRANDAVVSLSASCADCHSRFRD